MRNSLDDPPVMTVRTVGVAGRPRGDGVRRRLRGVRPRVGARGPAAYEGAQGRRQQVVQ